MTKLLVCSSCNGQSFASRSITYLRKFQIIGMTQHDELRYFLYDPVLAQPSISDPISRDIHHPIHKKNRGIKKNTIIPNCRDEC